MPWGINTKSYGIVVRSQVAEKNGIVAITDDGRRLFGQAGLRAPLQLGMGGGRSPGGYGITKCVRVTWRKPINNERVSSSGNTYQTLDFGEIIGDYTIAVTSHISQEVLNYVSQKKAVRYVWYFCMMDDGVLLAWSVQERNGHGWIESMHGGDFKDAEILDGKVLRNGWYSNKSGEKIEVN